MLNKITDKELIEACILTNEVSEYTKEAFEAESWPQDLLVSLPTLTQNWRIHHASHWELSSDLQPIGIEQDYQGLILVNDLNMQIIVAHRGLQLRSLQNLVSGFLISTKSYPKIAADASELCNIALKLSIERGYQLFHTGFSMGGYLAQITGAFANHKHPGSGQVICFDAPGAVFAIEMCGYNDNRHNTINYVTAPNIVNTINAHYGYVRQVTEFQGQNFFLKTKIKPHVVDSPLTFNIDRIDKHSASLLKDIFYITLIYHDKNLFQKYLSEDTLEFTNVCGWPVSTLTIQKVEDNEAVSPQNVSGSYGFVLDTIIEQSKNIRKISGYEDSNELSYHLPHPTVIYSAHSEQFCQDSKHLKPEPNDPIENKVNNDENPEDKYDQFCAIL